MNNDITTQEQIDHAISSFTTLLSHPGFILLKKIVDANIGVVSQYILEGVPDETKESIDLMRVKLQVYKEVINTPQEILTKLTEEDVSEIPDSDPYPTIETMKKDRDVDKSIV